MSIKRRVHWDCCAVEVQKIGVASQLLVVTVSAQRSEKHVPAVDATCGDKQVETQVIPCQVCLLSRYSLFLACDDSRTNKRRAALLLRARWKTAARARLAGNPWFPPGFPFKTLLPSTTNTIPIPVPRQ